jgi:integrase
MKQQSAGGRIFRRKSRLTGHELPTWWISLYVDGKEVRESAKTMVRAAAKKLLTKRLAERDEGTYVGPEHERMTVAEALEQVELHYQQHQRGSLRTLRGHVCAWLAALGTTCEARDVQTPRLRRITSAWQADGLTAATINRRLSVLRRAYRLARVTIHPKRLDFGDLFLPEHSPLGKYISPATFAAIAEHLPTGELRAFCEFAMCCGTRKGQLARTTIAHLDTATWVLTWQAREVKAKKPHVLPLDGRPLDLIADCVRRRPLHCPYLFHGPRCAPGVGPSKEYGCIGDFKKAWATACKRAGLPVGRRHGGYVFHNMRHSAVTNLVNSGTPAHEAMRVSGHATRSMLDRYSIGTEDATRAALQRQTVYLADLRTRGRRKVIPLAEKQAS